MCTSSVLLRFASFKLLFICVVNPGWKLTQTGSLSKVDLHANFKQAPFICLPGLYSASQERPRTSVPGF